MDIITEFYSAAFDAEREREEQLRERIEECAEDGKVAIVTAQLDCDCAEFFVTQHVDADFDVVDLALDRIYECAEGPVRWSIEKPSEHKPCYKSGRDLALEAYEDGHPHSVTW